MKDKIAWSWISKRTKGNRKIIFILLICICLIALFNIMNAASLKLLLDIATKQSSIPLWIGMIIPMIVVISSAFFQGILSYFTEKTIFQISLKIKLQYMDHTERIPLMKYNQFHSGDVLTRLSDDTQESAKLIPSSLLALVSGIISCTFALCYAFYLSWKMTIVVILLAPLIIIWSKVLLPKVQKYAMAARVADSSVRAYSQEQLANITTIKTFSAYLSSTNKFKTLFDQFVHKSLKRTFISVVLRQGASIIGFLSFATTVAFGSYLVLHNELTVGSVIGFAQMLNYIIWPFTEMMTIFGAIQTGLVATKRVLEIMNIDEEYRESISDTVENFDPNGKVTLLMNNVSFSYPEQENHVIDKANLSLSTGELVGVVGKSGCGKSTLLRLLLSLYEPTEGEILIQNNGVSIRGTAVRNLIAFVPQDHVLFSGSIEDNIRIGDLNSTKEEIINAAKKANIHTFIMSLPEEYNTILDEAANNISYGQTQRIAIARALLKNSPILILDEPTAALDKESEQFIMQTLKNEAKTKLCIMVSHSTADHEVYNKFIYFEGSKIIVQ